MVTATFANLPQYNLDAQVLKDIGVWKEGRVGATLSFQVTNVLNHMQPGSPCAVAHYSDPFGRITSQSTAILLATWSSGSASTSKRIKGLDARPVFI